MGFVGYPQIKLLTKDPYYYKEYINSFSIIAAESEDSLMKRPSIEDMMSGDYYRDFNFLHFDPLIGANGAVMLPPVYDEENTLLTMQYKVDTGEPLRELTGTGYSAQDVFDNSIPDDIDEIIGVNSGERYQPYTGVLDGIDYSRSSQHWEEVWAERETPRERPITDDEEEATEYYIDNYRVKVHQDRIKEDTDIEDPVIDPPENEDETATNPDLHFCLRRTVNYPAMPAGLNEDGEVDGLQVFWVEFTRGPATPSQQTQTTETTYPVDENYTEVQWEIFDPVTEEPFVSIGFGSASNNRRIEIVFPTTKVPYAAIWYQDESSASRTNNVIYPLTNAVPVMAAGFNVFIYVMLGEIAIRVTNADMTAVIWEDKIVDRGQSDNEKRYVKTVGAAPYVRGKNMRCTVGLSRLRFEKAGVAYTPSIQTHVDAVEADVEYNLHGSYSSQYIFPVTVTSVEDATIIYAQDHEPTEDKATGDYRTTFSYMPNTYIYSYTRSTTKGKIKTFYWLIVLSRINTNEYITPLLFSVEATAPPIVGEEPPEWIDITDLLIEAQISQSAPDYYNIDQYLNLSIRDDNFNYYDDEGELVTVNSYAYFSTAAREIRLQAGWYLIDPDLDQPSSVPDKPILQNIFTGFVSNVSLDYVAELNIVNLKISHMIERMKNTPILLSPFYDGMETSGVIKDLVKRGQLFKADAPTEPNIIFIEDGVEVEAFSNTVFYLGVGKDYQSPTFKFGGDEMIMDCIRKVASVDGARIYGHPNGALVYQKSSQGQIDAAIPVATFYSLPSTGTTNTHSEYYTMFAGLTFEQTPHESFNQVQVITVERDLRKPIVVNYPKLDANGEIDVASVGYLRIYRRKDPALGDQAAANIHARNLAKILFYPPKKAHFEGFGHPELLPIQVIEVVTSKGNLGNLRIVSISSTIIKDDNDFKYEASYELEWQNA